MGLGRKANKEDTSATSTSGDESSCMPSEMAADLSNSALEVAAQFSDVSDNRTQSWERSEVTSEGKSSSDDAPSSQDVGPSQRHDEDKSEEIVAEVAAEKEIGEGEEIVAEIAAEEEIVAEVAAEEEIAEEDETVAEEDDVAAKAAFRKHLEDVALEPPTFSQGVETSTAAVQGLALAPQAGSADAPAPDEQDECATTDDEHGVEEDEAEAEKPLDETEPPPAPKDSKVEQLCGWMAAACGLDSKVVAKYAEALVGEGVDQPSDLADLDDGDWPSSIKTLHLKKIKAAVAKGDFDVPELEDTGAGVLLQQHDEVPHSEPAVTDDAVPADEVVADKEPAVEDNDAPADGAAADKEKKEKQHAEIVAKRHKAALAKKKRDEKREAKAAAAREEETDEEAEPAAEPAQVEPEAGEANETVAMEADESGEADASSMGYEAVMPHEEESEPPVAESAPRKKKRGSSLHAAASSTTETPPPTLLNAKQRKKKQIEVGSSESAGDPSQAEPEPMDEDAEESEAPKDKKKKSRKKRLSLSAEVDGEGESTGEADAPKKSKKRKSADGDGEVQPKAKKGPKKGRSSYILFSMEQRKSAEISELPFAEAGKAISEKWKEVSAEEKATYDDMAKVDKMRYQREQKAFDAEHGVPEARPKPKSKPKKSKPKPAEESGEDDEPATTSDEPHQATKPRVLPMPLLELGTLVPRTKHPMRTKSIEVGDKLVWVPQAFDVFDENYASTLDKLSLTELPNDVSTDLMRRPADGTANGVEVLKVSEPSEFAPELKDQLHGWQLLRLKSLALPGGEAGPEGLEYNLPVIRRSECDVDMHVCSLEQYEASKRWKVGCGSESQVCVRFADEDSKQEEEWEGRIWDEQPHAPNEYPNSTYKRLRLLWYVKSSDDPNEQTPANTQWIMDPDQTDTEVSPWEARPSTSHSFWLKKNQELAKFNGPMRLDRGTLRKLVPQPESEQVCPAAMQDDGDKEISEQLVERVLKQICSIEATASLWHPVDKSEKDYYAYVKDPNSLSKIDGKWRAGKYVGASSWRLFAADVQLLVDNAQDFNDDDTLWFTLAGMVQREMQHAINQIGEHWPQLLI